MSSFIEIDEHLNQQNLDDLAKFMKIAQNSNENKSSKSNDI